MLTDARCYLEGEWTMDHVKARSLQLRNHPLFTLPCEGEKAASRLVINVEGVTTIDAAGCQLLTVWLSCLEFFGVNPALENPPEALLEAARRMGFDYTLEQYLGDK
ncbi:STAS domain-containing protein [Geomonas propionica]|uniref:STAS domain-containing protein n=1 Tax=Geomonas propionica TaxID=2798582 RepID=A0ABS0YQ16_9BACT|nr:STAS domain-containing protein [Geomonas propionica]MBJ6800070.1 STAS domain-containing protein [Geomonas propionica]